MDFALPIRRLLAASLLLVLAPLAAAQGAGGPFAPECPGCQEWHAFDNHISSFSDDNGTPDDLTDDFYMSVTIDETEDGVCLEYRALGEIPQRVCLESSNCSAKITFQWSGLPFPCGKLQRCFYQNGIRICDQCFPIPECCNGNAPLGNNSSGIHEVAISHLACNDRQKYEYGFPAGTIPNYPGAFWIYPEIRCFQCE